MSGAEAEFAPDASSVRAARAFVLDQLPHGSGPTDTEVRSTVELLVSELAANAVLHARTAFVVHVARGHDRVRVEVTDRDPREPSARPFSLDAPTGRGLRILDSMADHWGTTPVAGGKTVWFEVATHPIGPTVPDAPDSLDAPAPKDPVASPIDAGVRAPLAGPLVAIHYRRLPVPLQARAEEHYGGLTREFAVIRQSDTHPESVPQRLHRLVVALTEEYGSVVSAPDAQLREAVEAGRDEIDVTYHLPRSAGADGRALANLLDETEEYLRSGQHLLSLATPPDLLQYREWFLRELERQLDGEAPVPWPEYSADLTDTSDSTDAADSPDTPDTADLDPTSDLAGVPTPEVTPPLATTSDPEATIVVPPGVRLDVSGAAPVLELSDELDLRSAGAVRDVLTEMHVRYAGPATIDLRQVAFVDSVGISVLATAHRRFANDGRNLELVVPDHLLALFEVTGLDQVFSIVTPA